MSAVCTLCNQAYHSGSTCGSPVALAYHDALEQLGKLRAELDRVTSERDDWIATAKTIASNAEILTQAHRDRVEKLEAALRSIAAARYGLDMADPTQNVWQYWVDRTMECRDIARRALEGK